MASGLGVEGWVQEAGVPEPPSVGLGLGAFQGVPQKGASLQGSLGNASRRMNQLLGCRASGSL